MRQFNVTPNFGARTRSASFTRTLAVLLPDITNQFFPSLINGIQLLAEERGFSVLLCQTGDRPGHERRYIELAIRQQVEGLILIGVRVEDEVCQELRQRDIPVVSLDRGLNIAAAATVELDNQGGGLLATRFLLALGHRRIAHIAGPAGLGVSAERAEGWRRAHAEYGVEPDERLLARAEFSEEGGAAAMESLLDEAADFTAVFAASDLCAFGAMAVLGRNGLSVPEDVSVVGFDDIEHARFSCPSLTTVRQPAVEMGRHAASLLVRSIEQGRVPAPDAGMVFPAELMIRASTARAPITPP